MADFSIKAVIGANVDQFRQDLVKGQESLKQFKNSAEGMGLDLKKLALSTVFVGMATAILSVIDNAQKARDSLEEMGKPIDASTKSVAMLGDSIDSLKSGLSELAITSLSFFTRAGEGWGMLINRIRGVTAEQEAMNESSGRSTEKVLKNIDKARSGISEAIAKTYEDLVKSNQKLNESTLSGADKLNFLTDQYIKLAEERDLLGVGSLGWMKKTIELNEKEISLLSEIDKLKESEQKRLDEIAKGREGLLNLDREIAKEEGEREKDRNLSGNEYIELLRLQSGVNRGLTTEESARLNVLKLQSKEKEIQGDIDEILKREAGALTEEDKARLILLDEQLQIIAKQVTAVNTVKNVTQDLTKEIELNNRTAMSGFIGGVLMPDTEKIQGASDKEIRAYIAQQKKKLVGAPVVSESGSGGLGVLPGNLADYLNQTQARNAIAAAEAELKLRSETRRNIDKYGYEGAAAMYKGNALDFGGFVSQMNQDGGGIKETNDLLKTTNDLLRGKFRNV